MLGGQGRFGTAANDASSSLTSATTQIRMARLNKYHMSYIASLWQKSCSQVVSGPF
jgi:hypothetical protein